MTTAREFVTRSRTSRVRVESFHPTPLRSHNLFQFSGLSSSLIVICTNGHQFASSRQMQHRIWADVHAGLISFWADTFADVLCRNTIKGHVNKRPLFINVILNGKLHSDFIRKQKFPRRHVLANVGTGNARLSRAECDYRLIHNENVCSKFFWSETEFQPCELSYLHRLHLRRFLKGNHCTHKSIKCPIVMKSAYLKTTITEQSPLIAASSTEKFICEGHEVLPFPTSALPARDTKERQI